MAQIFTPKANAIARGSLLLAPLAVASLVVCAAAIDRSPYVTRQGVRRNQPVPFSHEHHVAGLGIDCRYCHGAVEISASAGMPATETCMTCHSQIWVDSPMLAPVRASFRDNRPLRWTRVHDLPDFVYFDHSIHVARGVGCSSCHGRVDRMASVYLAQPLSMSWCLDCHRDPGPSLGPAERVFDMAWTAERRRDRIEPAAVGITGTNEHCWVCHR